MLFSHPGSPPNPLRKLKFEYIIYFSNNPSSSYSSSNISFEVDPVFIDFELLVIREASLKILTIRCFESILTQFQKIYNLVYNLPQIQMLSFLNQFDVEKWKIL